MIISPPFLPASGLTFDDASKSDPMMDAVAPFEIGHHGVYPVTFDRRVHCGIHLDPGEQHEPVRAIADGDVVVYQVCKNAISDGATDPQTGQPLPNSNAGFVLLRHKTDTGEGRTITYYSLYMHLLDMTSQENIATQPNSPPETGSANALPKWLLDTAGGKDGVVQPGGTKKVYRKDMLGYVGQHQGVRHLHFEIFMADADLTAWFDQDGHKVQLGDKNPLQPASSDYWGHSYFVIHGPQDFVAQPAGLPETWFPPLPGGSIGKDDTLYVEAWFNQGRRYTRAWIDRGNSDNFLLLTPDAVADPYDNGARRYEYDLRVRAEALYSECPSDGYEMLRFGRILSSTAASGASPATWVAVPFDENGTQGYVNIAPDAIKKLSDADFPFFTGWQKVGEDNTPFAPEGLCDYSTLCGLTGIRESLPSAQPLEADKNNNETNLQLASYIQNTDGVREKLRGMVFKARSEWDPSNNKERYKDLNDPYGFFGKQKDINPDGYTQFTDFLSKFQFLDKTPLAGQELWFFHPLAFIRHFRKCGWLSVTELAQCLPRKIVDQTKNGAHQTVYPTSTLRWGVAHSRAERFAPQINIALRKYGISTNGLRTAYFLGNAVQETIYLSRTSELGGAQAHYAPWYGRGVIQLTFEENYKRYGDFRKWVGPTSGYRDSLETDLSRACDSAGFYWVSCAKPAAANHNINVEADKLPKFTVAALINVCSDYNYHDTLCRVSLSNMEFRVSSEFEKSARAVNTGNPNSTGTLNGLMPRTNVFLSSVAKLTDILIDYPDAYSQKE
jgi:predicted chitinase